MHKGRERMDKINRLLFASPDLLFPWVIGMIFVIQRRSSSTPREIFWSEMNELMYTKQSISLLSDRWNGLYSFFKTKLGLSFRLQLDGVHLYRNRTNLSSRTFCLEELRLECEHVLVWLSKSLTQLKSKLVLLDIRF